VPLRCNNINNNNNNNQETTFDTDNFISIKRQEDIYDYDNHRPYTNRRYMVVIPASTREGADQASTCTRHMRTRTMGLYNNF